MKNKILFGTMLALLLVGSVSFADDDADKKRLLEEYDKMQEEKAKEQPQTVTEVVGENGEVEQVAVAPKKAEKAKPKTEAEKLELTRKKAMDKLDFYERVVRSVAREENEVSDYYEIMGEKKQRSTVMLGTAPEEAPAEQQQVEQNAAPTEAQATPETKVEEAK